MNYFLIFIILVVCYGAYYENTIRVEKNAVDEKRISDLDGQINKLQAENLKLKDDDSVLEKSLKSAQAQITDLNAQIQATKATEAAKAAQLAVEKTSPTSEANPSSNSLGTIATLDGKTFQNCQLLKVATDRIIISHSSGISEVSFIFLPPELQKRFSCGSHQAVSSTATQLPFQANQKPPATP